MKRCIARLADMKNVAIIAGALVLGTLIAAGVFVDDARRTERRIVWHPGETSTFIDPLYPPGRMLKAENGEQVMKEEPGYTDIRLLRGYSAMSLQVSFENPDAIPIQVGMRTKDGGMKFGERFKIDELQNVNGRAQVIISAPELRTGAEPLIIKKIEVRYEK